MTETLVIRNGRVLIGDRLVGRSLAVAGGVISFEEPDRVDAVIDAEGWLVAPGFIDLQINGGFGYDFTSDPSSIWEVGRRLPSTGVTAFLPTIITAPAQCRQDALEIIAQGPPPGYRGARPLGLHFEGPALAAARRGTHQAEQLEKPDLGLIAGWSRAAGVRLVTLAPELAGSEAVIRELIDRDVVVAAGHSDATFDEASEALRLGVTHGTHLFNGMPPFSPYEPGLVGALLDHPTTSVAIIADGIHLHPAAVRLVRSRKSAGKVVLITDAMAGMGAGPGEYRLHDLTVTVDDVSARNEEGGLAGSILTLDQAVRNYFEFTACEVEEALSAASTNAADVIGDSLRGRIGANHPADLVLMDGQLSVQATLIDGEFAYRTREFDARIDPR